MSILPSKKASRTSDAKKNLTCHGCHVHGIHCYYFPLVYFLNRGLQLHKSGHMDKVQGNHIHGWSILVIGGRVKARARAKKWG